MIVQPLTGAWLIWQGGFDWTDRWLVLTYALYLLAGLCWVPVVFLQIAIKRMIEEETIESLRYRRLVRWWFALGWPAFGGLVVIFWLMVAKPGW